MRHLLLLLSLSLGYIHVTAQDVVDVERVLQLSKDAIRTTVNSFTDQVEVEHGVEVYRMSYTTTGSDGALDTASGLFVLPDELDIPLPITVYHHGTLSGRSAAPSLLVGQEYFSAVIMSSLDMIVLMPDYLGIGESRGMHPYVHAETEGSASSDMILAVRSYLVGQEIAFSSQLFLTGYSQGGHAAMATHQYIQEQVPELDVTASVPMSGPYFISGVMRGLIQQDAPFFYPAYIVYSLLGLEEVQPGLYGELGNVFRPEFIDVISTFEMSGDGLFDMNRELLRIMIEEYKEAYPRYLFLDTFYNAVVSDDNHPINVALRESDVYDWVPESPVLMLYCPDDDQVPYTNSLIADSTMNALGAADVSAEDVSGGAPLDHTGCVLPALLRAIPWILGQVDRTATSSDDILLTEMMHVGPNPVTDVLHIYASDEMRISDVMMHDLLGRLIHSSTYRDAAHAEIDMSSLLPAMYVLQIQTEDGIHVRQIIKN